MPDKCVFQWFAPGKKGEEEEIEKKVLGCRVEIKFEVVIGEIEGNIFEKVLG